MNTNKGKLITTVLIFSVTLFFTACKKQANNEDRRQPEIEVVDNEAPTIRLKQKENPNNEASKDEDSWISSQGGIKITHTLIASGDRMNLKRKFADGGTLDCYVTKTTTPEKTYLRPVKTIESGDYWIIKDDALICMDSLGLVYIANKQ